MKKILILLSLCIIGCESDDDSKSVYQRDRFFTEGRGLVRESYFPDGKLFRRKSYNRDTVAKGAEIEHYPNGNISEWKWFDTSNRYSYCVLYFDSNGRFDEFKGTPFIRAELTTRGETAVEMIKPPNVKYWVRYRDFYKNKIVKSFSIEPGLTDTTCWATLDMHVPTSGHTYFLIYSFSDSNNVVIDSSIRKLETDL
jgi:hypothetical protein